MNPQARRKGGTLRAAINKQDTKHGKMDMPFTSLNKYAGMKEGGNVRKFAEGGHLERLAPGQSFKDAFKEARGSGAKTFSWRGKKYTTDMAKPPAAAPSNMDARDRRLASTASKDYGDEAARMARRAPAPTSDADFKVDTEFGMKRGGNVKESKAMMKKEIGFMQKKGAPKSMIAHEKAEAKAMKFARGGGIESKGKTKGTIIKMASGGSVRGGGCEQRGKTRGKMV